MPSTTATSTGTGKYANTAGGIVFEAAGDKTATWFTHVTVQGNMNQRFRLIQLG